MNEGQWKVESTKLFVYKKNTRTLGVWKKMLFLRHRMEYFRAFQLKLTTCYNSFKYFQFPKKKCYNNTTEITVNN